MENETLDLAMVAIEEEVYESPDNLGCVDAALIVRTHIHCARRFSRSISGGLYDLDRAMVLYREACNRTVESQMALPNAGEAVITAREKEILPRQQQGPWTWEDVMKRAALPRNMPAAAIDTLGQYVLQVGDQAVEYDEAEDSFHILGADGKVRSFEYEKLLSFRPSAVSGEKAILVWERQFVRSRESRAEGISRL